MATPEAHAPVPLARNLTELLAFFNYAKHNTYDAPTNPMSIFNRPASYVPHSSGTAVTPLCITFMSLALIVVTVRLYVRAFVTTKGWGLDDWFIIPAAISTIGFTFIGVYVVEAAGVGHHAIDLTADKLIRAYPYQLFGALTKMVSAFFIKLSICFFHLRLCPFTDRLGKRLVYFSFVLITVTFVYSFFFTLFLCTPVKAGWDFKIRLYGNPRCISFWKDLLGCVIIWALGDLWLLLLPLRFLARLNLPSAKKAGLGLIFMFGGAATSFAFLKISVAKSAYGSWDGSYNIPRMIIYAEMELTLGLIAASLPSLGFMLLRFIPNKSLSTTIRYGRLVSPIKKWLSSYKSSQRSVDPSKSLKDPWRSTEESETEVEKGYDVVDGPKWTPRHSYGTDGMGRPQEPMRVFQTTSVTIWNTDPTDTGAISANKLGADTRNLYVERAKYPKSQTASHATDSSVSLVIQHPNDARNKW